MLNTEELSNIHEQLHNNLQHFEHYYTQVWHPPFRYSLSSMQVTTIDHANQQNNQSILPKLVSVLASTHNKHSAAVFDLDVPQDGSNYKKNTKIPNGHQGKSYRTFEYLLQFLDDADLMSLASTCRVIYHLVYSPLGYRLIRYLRPIVCVKGAQASSSVHKIVRWKICLEMWRRGRKAKIWIISWRIIAAHLHTGNRWSTLSRPKYVTLRRRW